MKEEQRKTLFSNKEEKLSDAPATMIVISENDILERGYYSISEIFSDLPGMDITRLYADLPVFNYWRGFRTAFSQPYIFMIDGMSYNDIFYNKPQIIDNIPLSNIEKIEIVYGPVSAIYGANAFMGVINVITKKKKKENSIISLNTKTRINNNGNFIEDFYTQYKKGKIRSSLAVRFETTDLAQKLNLDDYYTMDANIMYQNLFIDRFSIALKVENIFNKKYFHPGINRADSGTNPGYWSDDHVWHGSQGWDNSLLPQPHRYFMLSLLFNM